MTDRDTTMLPTPEMLTEHTASFLERLTMIDAPREYYYSRPALQLTAERELMRNCIDKDMEDAKKGNGEHYEIDGDIIMAHTRNLITTLEIHRGNIHIK